MAPETDVRFEGVTDGDYASGGEELFEEVGVGSLNRDDDVSETQCRPFRLRGPADLRLQSRRLELVRVS